MVRIGSNGSGSSGRKEFPEGGFPDGGFPDGGFPDGGFPGRFQVVSSGWVSRMRVSSEVGVPGGGVPGGGFPERSKRGPESRAVAQFPQCSALIHC